MPSLLSQTVPPLCGTSVISGLRMRPHASISAVAQHIHLPLSESALFEVLPALRLSVGILPWPIADDSHPHQ